MNQFIAVYNSNGEVISNIKYYEGFMGQRIGAISCLAFHPHWVRTRCTAHTYPSTNHVVMCLALGGFFYRLRCKIVV